MLANWLRVLGVDHVIVDRKDGPTRESRAIAVQARSMELYAQLGLIDPVRDAMTTARFIRPGWMRHQSPLPVPLGRIGAGRAVAAIASSAAACRGPAPRTASWRPRRRPRRPPPSPARAGLPNPRLSLGQTGLWP